MSKTGMTSRERLMTVFAGGTPDCVPVAPLADSFAARDRDVRYADLTWQDQVASARHTGLDLLLNTSAGAPDVIGRAWRREPIGEKDGDPLYRETLTTPVGTVSKVIQELPYDLPWTHEYPVKAPEDLRVLEYVADWTKDIGEAPAAIAAAAAGIGEAGVVHTWLTVPLELCGWTEGYKAMMLALEEPARMRGLCDKIHAGQIAMMTSAMAKGSDILAFGIPGTELTSPDLFREFALPYAREFVERAEAAGKRTLLHMCGHVSQLLDLIQEIHPTVLETLAAPPEGDVEDINAARDMLGRDIVAKGNLSITFLAQAEPEAVYAEARRIIAHAGADRFILGVSDVLLGHHAFDNIAALARAGHEWKALARESSRA